MPVVTNKLIYTSPSTQLTDFPILSGTKSLRLESGRILAIFKNNSNNIYIYSSDDEGETWASLKTINVSALTDFSATTDGKNIVLIANFSAATLVNWVINGETGDYIQSNQVVDTNQLSIKAISTSINHEKTEIHVAWSGQTNSYPQENIRYAKATINKDGSLTWGNPIQVSVTGTSGSYTRNPSLIINELGKPVIICEIYNNSTYNHTIGSYVFGTSSFTYNVVYQQSSWDLQYPCAIFVPKRINNLNSGRMWVVWRHTSTTAPTLSIRVSYSDDGGTTWSSISTVSTGATNSYSPSITADNNNKVTVSWSQLESDIYINKIRSHSAGTWGTVSSLSGSGYGSSQLVSDPSFNVVNSNIPATIRVTSNKLSIEYISDIFVKTKVTPYSSNIGDKMESGLLHQYNLIPQNSVTVTNITEKVGSKIIKSVDNPVETSINSIISKADWDELKFWVDQVLEVSITNSAGLTNKVYYTFNKKLSTQSNLLDTVKAVEDSQVRIKSKKEVISSKLGIPLDSDLDDIINMITNGGIRKSAGGTLTTNNAISTIPLDFIPSILIAGGSGVGYYCKCLLGNSWIRIDNYSSDIFSNHSSKPTQKSIILNTVNMQQNLAYNWIAIE